MNRTSLVIALIVPSLLCACGAGENTVGTEWPDAGNAQDTSKASDSCSDCTPGAAKLAMSRREGCLAVAEGKPGRALTFDITNIGSAASGPLSTSLGGGADAPLFLVTSDTCAGSALAPGATCSVVIASSSGPTLPAPESATLTVTDGQTSVTASLPVSDIGTVTVSPATLSFGAVAAGSTSDEAFIQVTTTSHCETKWTVVVDNPNFVISSNTCTGSIAGTCRIGVRFAPLEGTSLVGFAGFLTLTGSDSGSATVALTGVITPNHPTPAPLMVSPAAFDFGDVTVGTSGTGTITVSFAKAVPTAVISESGTPFAIVANTCKAAVETCTIQIRFAPTVTGASSATLYISDGQAMGTVVLQGKGLAASVAAPFSVTPVVLDFGQVPVTVTSSPLNITVTTPKARTFKLTLSDGAATEVAIAAETCSAQVPAGGTCTISLTYTPTKVSTLKGVLDISDGSDVVAVTLSGVGWTLL